MPPAPLPAPEGTMLAQLAALSLLASSGQPVGWPDASSRTRIEVWTNRGDDAYASGQGARVSFRTEVGAFLTVLRVVTEGPGRVLSPRGPVGTAAPHGHISIDLAPEEHASA